MWIQQIDVSSGLYEFQTWLQDKAKNSGLLESQATEVIKSFAAVIEKSKNPKTSLQTVRQIFASDLISIGLSEGVIERISAKANSVFGRMGGTFQDFCGEYGAEEHLKLIGGFLTVHDRSQFARVNTETFAAMRALEENLRVIFFNTPGLKELLERFGLGIRDEDLHPCKFLEWEKKLQSKVSILEKIFSEEDLKQIPSFETIIPSSRRGRYPGPNLVQYLHAAKKIFDNDHKAKSVIIKNPRALQWASAAVKEDQKFITELMNRSSPWTLRLYLNEELIDDREFCLVVMQYRDNVWAFRHTSETLRNDREVVLAVVRQCGWELAFAGEALKNDREIVFTAMKKNFFAIKNIGETLKNDREFFLETMRRYRYDYVDVLVYASEDLKKDRKFLLEAVRENFYALSSACNELKGDREIVLAAVSNWPEALQYANDEMKNDREVVLTAVRQKGTALQYASHTLKNDREVVFASLSQFGFSLQFVGETLKNDREVVFTAMRNWEDALEYASDALKNDREFIIQVLREHGSALKFLNENLRNDREVVLTAVRNRGYALQYASEALKKDREVVLTAAQASVYALEYASSELKNNREFAITILCQNRFAFQFLGKAMKNDREVVLTAVQNNWAALKYASETLQKDQEIMRAAAKAESEHLKDKSTDRCFRQQDLFYS